METGRYALGYYKTESDIDFVKKNDDMCEFSVDYFISLV